MRLTPVLLFSLAALSLAAPAALGGPLAEPGWTIVAEDADGNAVVRHLTQAELDHEAQPVDERCGGVAPAAMSCTVGPMGPFWNLGHGFMLPDCVPEAMHQPCYVGTLESKLEGTDGATRVLRWNRAILGSVSVVNLVTTAEGAWPVNQQVTQTCTSYALAPAQNVADPIVPGGLGGWECFMNHWPH